MVSLASHLKSLLKDIGLESLLGGEDCPVDGLASLRDDPDLEICTSGSSASLEESITELVAADVPPDAFLFETGSDRFAALTACSPIDVAVFKTHQDYLAQQISKMAPEVIAATLQSLFQDAYRYDPASREMAVSDQDKHRALNMWIAVLHHRAFQDSAFLARVDTPAINLILTLNSPQLNPADRGLFHQLRHKMISSKEFIERDVDEALTWYRQYDGVRDLDKEPQLLSKNELDKVLTFWRGEDKNIQEFRKHYPDAVIKKHTQAAGLTDTYQQILHLDDQSLIEQFVTTSLAISMKPNAASMRQIIAENMFVSFVMMQRGLNPRTAGKEQAIKMYRDAGMDRKDARLLADTEKVNATATRLDDYQARRMYMDKFRELYQDFLTTPMPQRFNAQNQARYNMWGGFILGSRQDSGVPLLLSDLKRIRLAVQFETGEIGKHAAPTSWSQVLSSQSKQPQWLRPADIQPEAGNVGLKAPVSDDVDYIAILPPQDFTIPHAVGVAHSLFGIVVLQKGWQPEIFQALLGHEAAHIEWFNRYFDSAPNRLTWTAAGELYAYKRELQSLDSSLASGKQETAAEVQLLNVRNQHAAVVEMTNQRLGLAPENRDDRLSFPDWDQRSDSFFQFQPGNFITQDEPSPDKIAQPRPWTEKELGQSWNFFVDRYFEQEKLAPDEEKELRTALKTFDQLKGEDRSPLYRHGHPFVAFYNDLVNLMNSDQGNPNEVTMPMIAMDGHSWRNMKDSIAVMVSHFQKQVDWQVKRWKTLAPYWRPFWQEMAAHYGIDKTHPYAVVVAGQLKVFHESSDELSHLIWQLQMLDEGKFDLVRTLQPSYPLLQVINRMRRQQGRPEFGELTINDPMQWLQIKIALLESYIAARQDPPHSRG